MRYSLFSIFLFLLIVGCGKSNESQNPPEIVSRDSDTVFNDIPGKHHLGGRSFNMNIVDLLENIRKANAFLEVIGEEGLRDTLKTAGPFTVFALSDATINQADTLRGRDDASDSGMAFSGETIKRYIIRGRITKADLADQPVTATDLEGNSVTLRLENDQLVIDDKVYDTSEEFVAENGVVYELQNTLE